MDLVNQMHRQLSLDDQGVIAWHDVHHSKTRRYDAAMGKNIHGDHGAIHRGFHHHVVKIVVKSGQPVG